MYPGCFFVFCLPLLPYGNNCYIALKFLFFRDNYCFSIAKGLYLQYNKRRVVLIFIYRFCCTSDWETHQI